MTAKQREECEFVRDLLKIVRNELTTAEKCQPLIDHLEDTVPHDELPAEYTFLVARRNRLQQR